MKQEIKEFANQYNADVQRIFLSIMITDVALFAKCRTIIRDEYFDDQFRPTVRYILEHADTYRAIPTIDMIEAKTGVSLSKISLEQVELQRTWFCDDFEGFCRYRAMENVILDGLDLMQAGKADEVSRRVKDALTIRLMSDLGTDYFDDPETRLKRLLDTSATVTTGWKAMDEKLFGGFVRGGLNIFLGNSGMGKSLVLQNLALNWALDGYNVIYFTLELAEDRTSLKIDAMLTGRGTRDVVRQISDTALLVKMRGKKAGRLFIKKYPGGGTNCNDFSAYLKEYEIINGFPPDAIIIDYLDLVHPNSKGIDLSNLHLKDKFVSEEIRALMHESNTFGATASQLTRGSIEALGEFDQSHTAGGISKINTSDNAIALYAPPQFKERGEFEFIFLKTRESTGVGHRMKLGYDNTCMRITDRVLTTNDVDKPSTYDELRKELMTKLDNGSHGVVTEAPVEAAAEPAFMSRLDGLMTRKRASTE
jgi:DnaB-like helicase C terminal domain